MSAGELTPEEIRKAREAIQFLQAFAAKLNRMADRAETERMLAENPELEAAVEDAIS